MKHQVEQVAGQHKKFEPTKKANAWELDAGAIISKPQET
jgi:hypothetical protein